MVVGGGVIGLSIALELLRLGNQVEVLEWGKTAGASSRAAAGMLAPVSEAELEDPEVLSLALDSLARFPQFVGALETLSGMRCDYRTDGTLWVAVTRDDVAEIEHLHETLTLKVEGLPARPLSAREVLEREPHLSGRVLQGLLVERDLQIDPRLLTAALAGGIGKLGGRVRRGVRVEEIVADGDRVRELVVIGDDDEPVRQPCDTVVLAAGAWSTAEIRSPVSSLGVHPLKGQLVRLRGPRLLHHVVRHPEVYLVPRESGELLVGATMEEVGFDAAATAGAVHDLLRHAWQVVPGLYDLELVEISVGFRPASQDNRPIIGPTGIHGLYVAVGHGRQGVLLAPATAHHLAGCIVSGRTPAELRAFAVDRFEELGRGERISRS